MAVPIASAPLAPLIAGDWRPLTAAVAGRLFVAASGANSDTGFSPAVGPRAGATVPTTLAGRALELPFYPEARLIELDPAGDDGRSGLVTLIEHPAGLVILDGSPEPIRDLNARLPVRLQTADQAAAYLRFFCAAVHRELGPCRIIEQPGDIPWRADATAWLRGRSARKVTALRPQRSAEGSWSAAALVLYGESLFSGVFEIQPDGTGDMRDAAPDQQGLKVAYEYFQMTDTPTRRRDDDPQAFVRAEALAQAQAQLGAGIENRQAGRYQAAADVLQDALDIQRRWLDPAHGDLAVTASWLGGSLEDLGRYVDAERLYREALAIHKAALPAGHPYMASSLGNLAGLYYRTGRYGDAEPLFREALAIGKAALPAGHPDIAKGISNLAALLDTTGQYDEAEQLHREALAIWRAALPAGHPDIAKGISNLAALLDATGQYDEAEQLCREALAITRAALPPRHPDIATSLNNLAALLHTISYYDEAEQLHREALAIRKAALSAGHPDIAVSLGNLAALLQSTGRYREAEPFFRDALAVTQAALPPGHPDIAMRFNNLAEFLKTTARYGEAEALYRDALDILKTALPSRHPNIALGFSNLATLLVYIGRYDEAEPLHRDALAIREAALPAGHSDIAVSLINLAALLCTTGRYGEAEPLYCKALAIFEAALASGHPDIAMSLCNLGGWLENTGRHGEAEPLYRKALVIDRAALPAGHPAIARSLNNLAVLLGTTRRDDEAEPLLREALAIRKAALPPDHPDIAQSLHNLALSLHTIGRTPEAEPLMLQALAIWKAALPPGHPDIAQSLNNLALLFYATDRVAEAEPLLQQALHTAQEAGAPQLLWHVSGNLSALYAAQDRRNLSIFFNKQSVNALQGVRRNLASTQQSTQRSFLKTTEDHYRHLANLLIADGRLPEAQQVLRMLKEQELYDFIRREAVDDPRHSRIGDTPFEAEQRAHLAVPGETLATLGAELPALRRLELSTPEEQARIRDLEARLAEANAAFQTALEEVIAAFETQRQDLANDRTDRLKRHIEDTDSPMAAVLADLARQSGRRVALVQYLEMEDRLHILVTLGDRIRAVSVAVSQAELNEAVQTFRDPGDGPLLRSDLDARPQAQWLYRQLIAPIAAELEAGCIETLMVYLDGALRYLPLAALHDGQQWLAERYALAVYTAIKDDNLKDPRLPHWQVAGFGVSSGHTAVGPGRRNFAALPGVARELDGIIQDPPLHRAGFLPGRVYLDPDFTQDALNAALGNARYPVIHLATHFALGSGDDDSFLLLGDGSPLTLRDLRRQPFAGVELVALSACDTAVELTAYAGREVEGLGTVVQQKGAKGVIATLWPVADASTGRFMQELYRLRVDRGLSKAESLRQAQRAFLRGTGTDPAPAPAGPPAKPAASPAPGRDATPFPASAPPYTPDPARPYAHPYYWAPFILMGNWL